MSDEAQADALTRRAALLASVAGVTGAAALSMLARGTSPAANDEHEGVFDRARMPVVFLPHGGGPWPFVETGIGSRAELEALAGYLRSIRGVTTTTPTALLVVSAHWEEPRFTVMTAPAPPMLFDYSGFPPESYRITWPAKGAPELAQRVRILLDKAGFATGEDDARGFDHGTFVPLKLTWPDADVPTIQLSLKAGLDPAEHIAMGRALQPLRNEGVLIVGSGMTYHNLRAFGPRAAPVADAFDRWLCQATLAEPDTRDRDLSSWEQAPAARAAHPREEHLLPLMVCAGAAGQDRARLAYHGTILGLQVSAFHFG